MQYLKNCSVKDCDKKVGRHGSKGMCGKHYQRVKRYNDPNYLTPESVRLKNNRNAQLERFKKVKPNTYRKFYGRHEHRVIMENALGRKLKKNEIVHHIDGNKHNNNLINLELLTQSKHVRLHLPEMLKARKVKHGY